MSRRYFILYDCPVKSCDKEWLHLGIREKNINTFAVGTPVTLSNLERRGGFIRILFTKILMICQALFVLFKSRKNDVVVCWRQQSGLFFNYFSQLCGNSRYIVSMCWLDPNPNLVNWMRKLCKDLILNPKATVVVNSKESPSKWKKLLSVESDRFIHLPDTINSSIEFAEPEYKPDSYYFTGGMTNRDWNTIIRLAVKFPAIKFVCVALETDWNNKVKQNLPSNVEVHFNTPSNEYYDMMRHSKAVLLPLASESVSGLINITMSAQMGVPCIITHTDATAQYYFNGSKALVDNNLDSWVDRINYIESLNTEQYRTFETEIQNYIKQEFDPAKSAEKIFEIFK